MTQPSTMQQPMQPRNMLTNNPNGANWLAAFDRPRVAASNRHRIYLNAVGRVSPPR